MGPIVRCFIGIAVTSIIGTLAQATPPPVFTAVPTAGGGGSQFEDSPHFRLYGSPPSSVINSTLAELEAAYSCFVDTLGWRSSGLSFNAASDDGPWYKTNIYDITGSLNGAAGVLKTDEPSGMGYLEVLTDYLTDPRVTVHEYGHVLTYHAKTWVDQTRTGAWWETVANFVAETYSTSPLCASARAKYGKSEGTTMIELNKVIGDSFQVLVDGSVDTGNYYQAWPFLTYLTNNPDKIAGLGVNTLHEMFERYGNNNETPFHVIQRITNGTTIQSIVGRYWARMAYLDIEHPQAQKLFLSSRSTLNFKNLEDTSEGIYEVILERAPRYMGANIIPLTGSGPMTATIAACAPFVATLAIYTGTTGAVRYVNFVDGKAGATIANGEEATLIVANTPAALIQYDGFDLTPDVNTGLDYTLKLEGATA